MKRLVSLLLVLGLTLLCLTGCTKHPSKDVIREDILENCDAAGCRITNTYSENYTDGIYTASLGVDLDKVIWNGTSVELIPYYKTVDVEYKLGANEQWELIEINFS